MTDPDKSALVAALAKLPTPRNFTVGYGVGRPAGRPPKAGEPIGVLILWDNTPDGRTAASLFAQALRTGSGA